MREHVTDEQRRESGCIRRPTGAVVFGRALSRRAFAGFVALLGVACVPSAQLESAPGAMVAERLEKSRAVFDEDIAAAVAAEDYAMIDSYRLGLSSDTVDRLLLGWKQRAPWPVKNGFVWLLMHRSEPDVLAIMWDGLDSPEPKVRVAAVVTLNQDPDLWSGFMGPDKVPDEVLIAEAIAVLRAK
jgi:hypothetical protein